MSRTLDVETFLLGPETTRRRELGYGILRQAPAPFFPHQRIVTRLAAVLDTHVRQRALGSVCVAPVDVILDAKLGVVAQPDVVFISTARLDIVRNQIWGPPDLVVEVLSTSTAGFDRSTKLDWYRRYGILEYWMVDPDLWKIEVVDCARPDTARAFTEEATLRSPTLSRLRLRVARVFED